MGRKRRERIPMAQETAKRQSKDSVFVSLFTDVNYVLQLYKELHPEDTDVTVEDIDVKTIRSVLVNTQYNDLGFFVKDKFIVLVEAQSLWNPNIPLRMMFYLAETYRRYLFDSQQSEHSTSRVTLPKPDLYLVYSGDKQVPDEISLSEIFFDGHSPVDVKVKVLDRIDETICGQYIGFCKVFDEQRKIYDNKLECVRETIRICVEKGYLTFYLKDHSKEAVDMMSELFDEEYLRSQYNIAERRKNLAEGIDIGIKRGRAEGRAEGKAEGILSTLAGLVQDGILTVAQAAERANVSVSEFETLAGLRA